jgi:hypothetical protein
MSDWATEARLKLIHQAIEEETWFPSGIDMTGAYDEVQAEKARLAEAAAAKEAEEKAAVERAKKQTKKPAKTEPVTEVTEADEE